jgi:hypothetical protein
MAKAPLAARAAIKSLDERDWDIDGLARRNAR